MKSWVKVLMRAFFPRRCIYCGRVTTPEVTACKVCVPYIPRMELPICYRCGRTRKLCTCKGRRRQFDRCIAAMRYEGGACAAVLSLKEHRNDDYVETMAQEMLDTLRERTDAAAFDAVTCVPMFKAELRRRGYNQSELLAREVAKELGVPFESLLTKIYDTCPQKRLGVNARSGNVLGVFDAPQDVSERHILLVDDVITSGATLHECAKMLKIRGAASVTALTFAAVVPKEKEEHDV